MKRLQTTEHFKALPDFMQHTIRTACTRAEADKDLRCLMIVDVGEPAYGLQYENSGSRMLCQPIIVVARSPEWYAARTKARWDYDHFFITKFMDEHSDEKLQNENNTSPSQLELHRLAECFRKPREYFNTGMSSKDIYRNDSDALELILSPCVYAAAPGFEDALDEMFEATFRRIDIADAYWGCVTSHNVNHIHKLDAAIDAGKNFDVDVPIFVEYCCHMMRFQWMRENNSKHAPVRLTDLLEAVSLPADVKSDVLQMLKLCNDRPLSAGKITVEATPETVDFMHTEMMRWAEHDEFVIERIEATDDKKFSNAAARAATKFQKDWSQRAFSND